jgi:hypothetical protein
VNKKQTKRKLCQEYQDLRILKSKKGATAPCTHEWHRLRRAIKAKLETIQRLENQVNISHEIQTGKSPQNRPEGG